jgi:hypothetical protein
MSGETEKSVSGWTVDTYAAHMSALWAAQSRFEAERDRRYAEIALERDRALKIKEQADRDALGLAREIQTYKDEKANELREQIGSERGLYATKTDLVAVVEKLEATIKPLADYIAADRGRGLGMSAVWAAIALGLTLVLGLIGIGTFVFVTMRATP